MMVRLKEVQVGIVIERRRRVLAFGKPMAVVLEIVPVVRAGQVNRLAGAIGEVAWVRGQHTQGSGGRLPLGRGAFLRGGDRARSSRRKSHGQQEQYQTEAEPRPSSETELDPVHPEPPS